MNLNGMIHLGKPVVLEMYFKNHPDKYIRVGQWIILWDEIPARKIGAGLYEVYPDAVELKIETPEERAERLFFDLPKQIDLMDEPLRIDTTPKYVRTKKGSKRVHPWESPMYF